MKYLGIDFGLRRIGLAISEGELASPWKVVEVKNIPDAVNKISQIILDSNFEKAVIGMPEGKMVKNVTGFVNGLKKMGISVEITDETLTSKNALTTMIELNIPKEKRKINDAYAAAEILQGYLDMSKI